MKLGGFVAGATPASGVANWVLEGVSTSVGAVEEVSWGGEVTTSTAMRTRIARDSAVGTGSRTAGNAQRLDQTTTTPGNAIFFSTTYATTQPTIANGALFGGAWNAHGGFVRWLAAPGEEFLLIGAASLECRQDVGTATSTFHVIWREQ